MVDSHLNIPALGCNTAPSIPVVTSVCSKGTPNPAIGALEVDPSGHFDRCDIPACLSNAISNSVTDE